jgi:pimeloyl-ACP methyl ester carboxylesterase
MPAKQKLEKTMTDFVIVHGAWAGAWAWQRVVDRLAARGHRVFAPTLSGLGERSHLAGAHINLTTHIKDVVNEIGWKDLDRVVLVGHSYGGFVITGAAEEIGQRIASIVYVDALIPIDGQAFADFSPDWQLPSDALIPSPAAVEGDYLDDSDRVWVNEKATPQPAGTFTERIRVTGAYLKVPKKTYVLATGWDGFGKTAAPLRSDPAWTVHEVACGHDIAIDRPGELAGILERAA